MYSPDALMEEVRRSIAETMRSIADPECEALLRQATDALDEDVPALGLSALEAAQIRRPSDSCVTLAIGLLRILAGDPRATEPLELIADRHDDRKAMLYLILARLTFGATRHAAADLDRLLRKHAPPLSPDALALCDRVAAESGAPGWCGLSSAGVLVVSIAEGAGGADAVAVRKDGVELPVSVRKDPHRALYTVGAVEGWLCAQRIEVSVSRRPLIGSAVDVSWVTRMEGFVASDVGGLSGWCWFPSDPDRKPSVAAVSRSDRARYLSFEVASNSLSDGMPNTFALPWRFAVGRDELADIAGPADIVGPSGRPLYGSPIDPMNFINSARSIMHHVAARFPRRPDRLADDEPLSCYEAGVPVSAAINAARPAVRYRAPKVAVVIPVYRGFAVTMNCLKSVIEADGIKPRVIVVVDASPDATLVNELKALAASGRIELHIQTVNRGFPATANVGFRLTVEEDVILLNSDTQVPKHWIDRLQEAVYQADDIGTATPISNDASIFSYPRPNRHNRMPSPEEASAVDTLAAVANGRNVIDVPTAHGFCMYIRSACLEDTGVFREDLFGQGYAEENDFSRRASVLGWRHVAVPGVYVAHVGGQSFSLTKTALIERNLEILNRLHLGYDQLIQDWLKADPLLASRRQIDILRLTALVADRRAVLLVTHDREGGVMKHVRARAADYVQRDVVPFVLMPVPSDGGKGAASLLVVTETDYPNITFRGGETWEHLRGVLPALNVDRIEVHHFIGHGEGIFDQISRARHSV